MIKKIFFFYFVSSVACLNNCFVITLLMFVFMHVLIRVLSGVMLVAMLPAWGATREWMHVTLGCY